MHQYFSADFRIINNKNILLYHMFSVHSPTRVLFLNTAQRKEVSQHIQEAVIPPPGNSGFFPKNNITLFY